MSRVVEAAFFSVEAGYFFAREHWVDIALIAGSVACLILAMHAGSFAFTAACFGGVFAFAEIARQLHACFFATPPEKPKPASEVYPKLEEFFGKFEPARDGQMFLNEGYLILLSKANDICLVWDRHTRELRKFFIPLPSHQQIEADLQDSNLHLSYMDFDGSSYDLQINLAEKENEYKEDTSPKEQGFYPYHIYKENSVFTDGNSFYWYDKNRVFIYANRLLSYSANGRYFVVAYKSGTVEIFDFEAHTEQSLPSKFNDVSFVKVKGCKLLVGTKSDGMSLWDLEGRVKLDTLWSNERFEYDDVVDGDIFKNGKSIIMVRKQPFSPNRILLFSR